MIVGIDHYDKIEPLAACVADAQAIEPLLARHSYGSLNYTCRLVVAPTGGPGMRRADLRLALQELFDPSFQGEVLFYFSGHGAITSTGGYLATSDAEASDIGIPMQEVVDLANNSRAADVLLMLDCCHSGAIANTAGATIGGVPFAWLREGVTVIAASRNAQASVEAGGHGLFTSAVLDALDGGAADHIGWVTAPSIYAYVERRFGPWNQTPVYKTHATGLSVIRECAPLIDRLALRDLILHFPSPEFQMRLDPEFEPEDEHGNVPPVVNHEKVNVAKLLKLFRDAGLVKPSTPGEQLFWTARRSHKVELTLRGREYWGLVKNNRI